jgi:four helix bundle protein
MENDKNKFKEEFTQRLIDFSLNTIRLCREYKQDSIYWSIIDQLIRSATSIGANVTEARAASSMRDYIKFFEIALKSAYETKYWYILLKNMKDKPDDEVDKMLTEVEEIRKVLTSAVLTMKGRK